MSNQDTLNRRKISAKDVRELLSDSQWSHDEAHSKLVHLEVYNHPDGRVLTVRYDKWGILYPSPQDFVVLLDHFNEARTQEPQHILKGRLPGGKDFPQYVPQLVNDVADLLKIPSEKLDYSFESLAIVDKKVRRLGFAKCIEPPIFAALVAYIGEVMRRYVKGRWEMILSDFDRETWEPWIFDPEGRSCNSWDFLYDMLTEGKLSILSTPGVEINGRRVRTFDRPPLDPAKAAYTVVIRKSPDPPDPEQLEDPS